MKLNTKLECLESLLETLEMLYDADPHFVIKREIAEVKAEIEKTK